MLSLTLIVTMYEAELNCYTKTIPNFISGEALRTACFHTAGTHPNAISIARFGPRWMKFCGAWYAPLAPTLAMLKSSDNEFDALYWARLEALDPQRVYRDLVALAGPDALLCCHEKPAYPCHRLIVSSWLEATLGIRVPELNAPVTTAARIRPKPAPPTDDPDAVRRYLAKQLHLDLDHLLERRP